MIYSGFSIKMHYYTVGIWMKKLTASLQDKLF